MLPHHPLAVVIDGDGVVVLFGRCGNQERCLALLCRNGVNDILELVNEPDLANGLVTAFVILPPLIRTPKVEEGLHDILLVFKRTYHKKVFNAVGGAGAGCVV